MTSFDAVWAARRGLDEAPGLGNDEVWNTHPDIL
jgi:hypothetical protein